MSEQKIKTEFNCQNIAPIESLKKEISSSSLKFGVFANNGSGKTFISRMFRLTENSKEISLDEEGNSPTDKLITLGQTSGKFSFKITDKQNNVLEQFNINLNKQVVPTIPDTNYLFHVFNEDYVEDNLRSLDYDKDDEIDGFILGKVNIDLSDDEEILKKIEKEGSDLSTQIENEISKYIVDKIDGIQNIKRLSEYRDLLTPQKIIQSVDKKSYGITKSYNELVTDYNKIKSVPENLLDIEKIDSAEINLEYLKEISQNCKKEYSLSALADNFKRKIKEKQDFIEKGIDLIHKSKEDSICPFCEQELQQDALDLIDKYTAYINDVESTTIKLLKSYKSAVENTIEKIENIKTDNIKRINTFNTYKNKYIPSSSDIELKELQISNLISELKKVITSIEMKLTNISSTVEIPDEILESIEKYETILNGEIESNNKKIDAINIKKNSISNENKLIRKQICKRTVDDLLAEHKTNIKSLEKSRTDFRKLKAEIEKKKEQEKVSKKKKVASTIKTVLNYFFADKYTLDEDSFRLTFNTNVLQKKQAKDILSAGEKNIVAFAYYIGDTHLKVNSEDDYKKLFFVIDDPISSMDFSHVYTLCGVVRDIKKIIDKLDRERLMIFTHNNDFMRILSSNNIVDKKLLLANGELSDFNNNLTVPYITHLLDIYRIARKGEIPTHTTANSIRHILETLTKFESIELHRDSLAEYIKLNIPDDTKSYTLIQDLSHGGWRTEQAPITNQDYKEVCEIIIKHIEKKFNGQIVYCEDTCK
ncbi:MAG: AAA family ATPase [Chlorobi bacterium]|nr:AAA family ATPase [Chlorobiota bacterium]